MSIEPDRFFSPAKDGNDARFDRALRPQALADYIGQQAVKEQMQIFIEAARQRGDAARRRGAATTRCASQPARPRSRCTRPW